MDDHRNVPIHRPCEPTATCQQPQVVATVCSSLFHDLSDNDGERVEQMYLGARAERAEGKRQHCIGIRLFLREFVFDVFHLQQGC